MTLAAFLPILMMILVFGLIFMVIKILNSRRAVQVPKKFTGWAFLIYSTILVISAGLYFLISMEKITYGKEINADTVENTAWQLHEAAREGRIGEIDSDYLAERWTFNLQGDQLNLETPGNEVNGLSIFVERKTEGGQTAEVHYYQTPMTLEGKELKNPSVPALEFNEDTLIIRKPEMSQLHFTTFTQEFPFAQFSGEGGMFNSVNHGRTLLYIRIPHSTELNAPAHAVQYAEE